jgi:hypothetical protein
MARRFYRTRRALTSGPPRQKVWARASKQFGSPSTTLFEDDLLSSMRTQFGIGVNLPGFTVGPFHIKIGVRIDITASALTGAEGIQVGIMPERINLPTAGFATPNIDLGVDWIWNEWVMADNQTIVSTTPVPLPGSLIVTREIHVQSMRKIQEVAQSVYLIIVPVGGVTLGKVAYQSNVMVRLP